MPNSRWRPIYGIQREHHHWSSPSVRARPGGVPTDSFQATRFPQDVYPPGEGGNSAAESGTAKTYSRSPARWLNTVFQVHDGLLELTVARFLRRLFRLERSLRSRGRKSLFVRDSETSECRVEILNRLVYEPRDIYTFSYPELVCKR